MSYFGTDGIRGEFGVAPITPDVLLRIAYVTGKILKKDNSSVNVVIGKDPRLSGYVVEAALQAGFNSAGVDVHLLGPIPTPAIAHITRSFHASLGIVISASHNPYQDNGIKFFSSEGKKISDELQESINAALAAHQGFDDIQPDKLGKSYRIDDAKGRYIEFCKGSFPYQLDLKALKIVVDCANGAGYSVAPRVLSELGANVIAINNRPDGRNINKNCGSTHPEQLQSAVVTHGADVGIALDGDGDRIIMVDELGHLVDGDGILYILATQGNTPVAGVVGTLMSNMGLQLILSQKGINFVRAKVGDRYVMQILHEREWLLGGEPSGHILCLDKSSTGDAIIAGLQVLAIVAQQAKSLSQLTHELTLLPQCLVNVTLNQMQDPYDYPVLQSAFANVEKKLLGRGRLLIRQSGTEPKIRIMVESDDAIECDVIANELAQLIEQTLN